MNEQLELPLDGLERIETQFSALNPPPNSFIFTFNDPPEEIIKLTQDGFFWKGKLIENDQEIYHKFNEWVNSALAIKKLETKSNSIEALQNINELFKQALKFYANKSNYDKVHFNDERGNVSNIDFDEYGSQARFALEQADRIDKLNEKFEKEYNAEIDALQNMSDEELLNTFMHDNNIQ